MPVLLTQSGREADRVRVGGGVCLTQMWGLVIDRETSNDNVAKTNGYFHYQLIFQLCFINHLVCKMSANCGKMHITER